MAAVFAVFSPVAVAAQKQLPRAIVLGFENLTKYPYATMTQSARETLAKEGERAGLWEVVTSSEIEAGAKRSGRMVPASLRDYVRFAPEVEADWIVFGEIRAVEIEKRGTDRARRVGMTVRVHSVALDELCSGAAVWGETPEPANSKRSEGLLLIDAASAAAVLAVRRMTDFVPVTGTVMNSQGSGAIVVNRGGGHGIRKKQEFLFFRNTRRVGRGRVTGVWPDHCEVLLTDSGGVRPEDRAIAVFPEPKLHAK